MAFLCPQSRQEASAPSVPRWQGERPPCPANLQIKSMGSSRAQVRFHPCSVRNGSANATAPSEAETMEDKTRLRIVSCLARPGWLHKPASGQSHVQGTKRGPGPESPRNTERVLPPSLSTLYSPTLPCSSWKAQHKVQSHRWGLRPPR